MSEGWSIKKLSEFCEIKHGYAFDGKDFDSDFTGENHIVLTPGNFTERAELYFNEKNTKRLKQSNYPADFVFKDGDLVVVMTDLSSKMKILGLPSFIEGGSILHNQRIGKFIFKNDFFDKRYLYYFLQTASYLRRIKETATGTMVRHTAPKRILDTELLVPELSEQKRIVEILDEAFAAIDKAKAAVEKNLQNAKELFESYLQNVFENKEEEYEDRRLEEVTELISKGSSPKWQGINYVKKPGVLFVTSENVGENVLLLSERKYVEEEFNKKDSKSILKNGDVLTNIVGASIGRTAIFDLDEIANINQAVCLIRCNPKLLFNKYLMYLLNSPFTKQHLHENEVNNARANLSLGFFRSLEIPVPPLAIQKTLVNKIKAFHIETLKLETTYQQKLNDLEELKKSILQKAFTGELTTVKQIAEIIT